MEEKKQEELKESEKEITGGEREEKQSSSTQEEAPKEEKEMAVERESEEKQEENPEDLDDDEYYVDEDEIQVQEVEPAVYEVETKIGTGELYNYLMMHTYSSFSGKVCVILSVLALIMLLLGAGKGDMTKTVILGIVALLYTVINPIMLYMKAARQAKLNPAYKDCMKFGFHEKGVNISFGGNEGMIPWDKMMKVKKTKKVYALYTDPIHAFLIAVKDLQKTGNEIENYIEEHITHR